jgi:transposase-like protein
MDRAEVPVSSRVSAEVSSKATRRRFTGAYKRRVLADAAKCVASGEVGALAAMLRREGLYSSQLSSWRVASQAGELAGLSPRKRGPKAKVVDARDAKIAALERENERFRKRAERAEALVELQKKVAELLGNHLDELPKRTS